MTTHADAIYPGCCDSTKKRKFYERFTKYSTQNTYDKSVMQMQNTCQRHGGSLATANSAEELMLMRHTIAQDAKTDSGTKCIRIGGVTNSGG
jgi:hypothetical protein